MISSVFTTRCKVHICVLRHESKVVRRLRKRRRLSRSARRLSSAPIKTFARIIRVAREVGRPAPATLDVRDFAPRLTVDARLFPLNTTGNFHKKEVNRPMRHRRTKLKKIASASRSSLLVTTISQTWWVGDLEFLFNTALVRDGRCLSVITSGAISRGREGERGWRGWCAIIISPRAQRCWVKSQRRIV